MKGKQRKFKGIKRPPERQYEEQNAALRALLRFDDVDMEANRNGEITERQLERLRGMRVVSLVEMLFFLTMPLFIVLLLFYLPLEMTCAGIVGLIWMAIFILYGLALVIREMVFVVNLSRDLIEPRIVTLTGSGKLAGDGLAYKSVHDSYWVTGNQWFNIRRESRLKWKNWTSFREGYCYTIFYVPHSRTLVSAEISRDEDIEALLERGTLSDKAF